VFESALQKYLGVPNVSLFCNGVGLLVADELANLSSSKMMISILGTRG